MDMDVGIDIDMDVHIDIIQIQSVSCSGTEVSGCSCLTALPTPASSPPGPSSARTVPGASQTSPSFRFCRVSRVCVPSPLLCTCTNYCHTSDSQHGQAAASELPRLCPLHRPGRGGARRWGCRILH